MAEVRHAEGDERDVHDDADGDPGGGSDAGLCAPVDADSLRRRLRVERRLQGSLLFLRIRHDARDDECDVDDDRDEYNNANPGADANSGVNPLVTLRADFQPEMLESINEIK